MIRDQQVFDYCESIRLLDVARFCWHVANKTESRIEITFNNNVEQDFDINNVRPGFWDIFKRAVDAGLSRPDEREPPTLKRMRKARLDCRAVALAVLHVAERREMRRWVARDIWRLIAKMVWGSRWE